MLKKLGIAAAILVAALVVYISTRPDRFYVERSVQLSAPADATFALINEFRQWQQWSPYEKLDPNLARTFEGPASGPGAVYAYKGDRNIGEGRMTILESRPGELVSIKLEFIAPFPATNQANFKLEANEKGTRVTWTMEGPNTLMGKVMSPFMDGFIGKSMEQGLADLDTAAQAEAKKRQQTAKTE
ncbi:SRPBCC family protein [Pyxidicoccus sp. MSG2]|uniref:SRPBCC family protein n=1 Tax=Pyxidicoccus sp. MSG2 TaxID=2996790 RepID=UPI00227034E5|nr:SRPBCC family protein [Pyxidicoccus sp. MSG2]MCY1019311.1 SRPBCC family protein [Pyxidicoccus sp. MSG2]